MTILFTCISWYLFFYEQQFITRNVFHKLQCSLCQAFLPAAGLTHRHYYIWSDPSLLNWQTCLHGAFIFFCPAFFYSKTDICFKLLITSWMKLDWILICQMIDIESAFSDSVRWLFVNNKTLKRNIYMKVLHNMGTRNLSENILHWVFMLKAC